MSADYSDEYIQRMLVDLRNRDDSMRSFAMQTLAEPACHARAIPALIGLLDDNTVIYDNAYDAFEPDYLWVCHAAQDTLKLIGAPALPAIVAALAPDAKPYNKTLIINLLLHFKVSSALAPILSLIQQNRSLARFSVEVVEKLADPARDTALVVPYLRNYYQQEQQSYQSMRQRYNLPRFNQNEGLGDIARILGKYRTPWAQFMYWRWRMRRILSTVLLVAVGLLFLTIVLILVIVLVPVLLIAYAIQRLVAKVRRRFNPAPPTIIMTRSTPAQGVAPFGRVSPRNPFEKPLPPSAPVILPPSGSGKPARLPFGGTKLSGQNRADHSTSSSDNTNSDTDITQDSSKE